MKAFFRQIRTSVHEPDDGANFPKIKKYIFLQTSLDVAISRIKTRARAVENVIDKNYMSKLDRIMTNFYSSRADKTHFVNTANKSDFEIAYDIAANIYSP